MANKAGKADKALGLRLIEVFLRIIAVKKYQPGSVLQAWLMENVPNSRNFVNEVYTFADLGLGDWAKTINLLPDEIALRVKNNGALLTASDYGSPQSRQRFVCGEIIKDGKFPFPVITHGQHENIFNLYDYVTLKNIKGQMPSPIDFAKKKKWIDPNYPSLCLSSEQLTDHFYDSGLYQVEWEMAKFAKVNHPFMGRMSFPEDENRPSRTIMATRSASTREALIYKSEYCRKGDGEFRLPTIREAATLMGFPYTYQFVGGETTKWKQIGNAVCPHLSSALAQEILRKLNIDLIPEEKIEFSLPKDFQYSLELNDHKEKSFDTPPRKKIGTKFRMHPFKGGNMTVALTNFDAKYKSIQATNGTKWNCSIYFGSGKEYVVVTVDDEISEEIKAIIRQSKVGVSFIEEFYKRIFPKIPNYQILQQLLEANVTSKNDYFGPVKLVNAIGDLIIEYDEIEEIIPYVKFDGVSKRQFPKKQIYASWAIYQAVKRINSNDYL